MVGPPVERSGAVVSLVTGGQRWPPTADSAWLDQVAPGPWLDDAEWLFVSGYALLRSASPDLLVALAAGRRTAVDLASAAMVGEYGADRFRSLWQALRPSVVFANEDEWAACGGELDGTLVLKQGARGATFDGVHRPALPTDVVDVTGAGDALGGMVPGGTGTGHAGGRALRRAGRRAAWLRVELAGDDRDKLHAREQHEGRHADQRDDADGALDISRPRP